MDKIEFSPFIDFPLAGMTVALLFWHFARWVHDDTLDTTVDLPSRLRAAQTRVVLLFAGLLLFCWTCNLALWAIFAILLGLGFLFALLNGSLEPGLAVFVLTGYAIREWAFGFPQLLLTPPGNESEHHAASRALQQNQLTGKSGVTTSPLRPSGHAKIDGRVVSVVSHDGGMLDHGVSVVVTSYRNGLPCVRPQSD